MFEEQDKMARERVDAKNFLENYAFGLKFALQNSENKLSESVEAEVLKATESTISWAERNPAATKNEYYAEKKKLENLCFNLRKTRCRNTRRRLMRTSIEEQHGDVKSIN